MVTVTPESRPFMCGNKVRYIKARYARKAARQMRRRGEALMAAYCCPFCEQWHIGHRRPS